MFGNRSLVLVACALVSVVGCGKDSSPTSPTTSTTSTTRIIGVTGNLAFGDVEVGQTRTLTLTIANQGTTVLNVSGMTVTGGLAAHTAASWTSGPIAAGSSQNVSIAFTPTAAGNYSGTLTVNGDQSSGGNTLAISGRGISLSFAGIWNGSYTVQRCDGTGSVQDIFCSANRGVFPVGTVLPIRVDLTQNGTSVSGTVAFGQVRGPVNGTVASGALTLQGTGTGGQITATISSWSTRVQGSSMTGNVTYNATYSGLPGTAVVVTRATLSK